MAFLSTPLVPKFRSLCEELSYLIEKEGWVVRPYSHPGMNFFKKLTSSERLWTTNRLSDYLEICRQTHKSGNQIKDARLLVRQGLQHFGFSCDVQVEDYIQPEYVVEFYGLDHRQIFRTFNFFEYTSYTVEDIYCQHWFDLYKREEAVTQFLIDSVQPLLAGKMKEPLYYKCPEHIIEERRSLEKLRFWAKEHCLAPLNQGDVLRGYLTILQVRPVET
ncbi:MAG: hypothetical protein ACM3MG_05230 [Bacillota bacterium]